MGNVDRYLLHAFGATEEEIAREAAEGRREPGETILLPMLVRVREASWAPTDVPDLQITSQMGDIVACLGSLDTIEALQGDPSVLSIEASRPGSGLDCGISVPFIHADLVHQNPLSEKGDKALVAIIDSDIDVRHDAFLDSTGTKTRIMAIWDQTDSTGPAPGIQGLQKPYGTVYTETDINNIIAGTVPFPQSLLGHSDGHGTHVASIAAGRQGINFAGGVAPEARIVVVIPDLKVGGTNPFSLGYSNSHVDALTYINYVADQWDLPVVVNVSQGMNAGAHDGTSLVEAAFDNFSNGGQKPGRVIIKSAGNERNYNGHARFSMNQGATERLSWESKINHVGPDTIELWFQSCDKVRARLENPSGHLSRFVDLSNKNEEGQFSTGNKYEISYEQYHHDNGDSRLLVTIKKGSRNAGIEPGRWTLEITSPVVISQGVVNAWMERDDSRPIAFINNLQQEMTLSIPGTARTVISVGSVDISPTLSVATYSSYGPTRDGRDKPELAAPGGNISAANAKVLNGVRTESGTSMAAPHVTGAIALLLSYWEKQKSNIPNWERLNAAQVRAGITQMTQNYRGRHNPGMGFGVLDADKLLKMFG
jgi:subtilisin family serine protease